jgi:hypothetical protein
MNGHKNSIRVAGASLPPLSIADADGIRSVRKDDAKRNVGETYLLGTQASPVSL